MARLYAAIELRGDRFDDLVALVTPGLDRVRPAITFAS
jgi:hypothetical protein